MQQIRFFTFFIGCALCVGLQAQKTLIKKPVEKPEVIRDTFAFNLLTTLDKVVRMAEDPAVAAAAFAGEQQGVAINGAGEFNSAIMLPDAVSTIFKLDRTDRQNGTTTWEWKAVIYNFPKEQQLQVVVDGEKKVDSVITAFGKHIKESGTNAILQISAWKWINESYTDKDGLALAVRFTKKLHNTEQGAIDSLVRLYPPLFADPVAGSDCAEKFGKALELEGISRDKVSALYSSLARDLTGKNIKAVFNLLIQAPYFVDYKKIKTELVYSQQEALTKMAQSAVDDYNAQYNPPPKQDVVTLKKKEIEKEKIPTDPCEKEKLALRIKPGSYVQSNGPVSYVKDYSCQYHTYTVCWIEEKTNHLKTATDVTSAGMEGYRITNAAPFYVCDRCQGQGYSMEYDWVQMASGSSHYARTNRQTQYSCGTCKGAGYIKIR
ncbi:MAG: hypothetical protein V4722_24620 [Bacteroidota bacterium]